MAEAEGVSPATVGVGRVVGEKETVLWALGVPCRPPSPVVEVVVGVGAGEVVPQAVAEGVVWKTDAVGVVEAVGRVEAVWLVVSVTLVVGGLEAVAVPAATVAVLTMVTVGLAVEDTEREADSEEVWEVDTVKLCVPQEVREGVSWLEAEGVKVGRAVKDGLPESLKEGVARGVEDIEGVMVAEALPASLKEKVGEVDCVVEGEKVPPTMVPVATPELEVLLVAVTLSVTLAQAEALGEEEAVTRPTLPVASAELVLVTLKDCVLVTVAVPPPPPPPPPPAPVVDVALALVVVLGLTVTRGLVGEGSMDTVASAVAEVVEDWLAVSVGVTLTVAVRVGLDRAEKDTEVVMAARPVAVRPGERVPVALPGSRVVPEALTLAVAVGVLAPVALPCPPAAATLALATEAETEAVRLPDTVLLPQPVAVKVTVGVPVWLAEAPGEGVAVAEAVAVAVLLAVPVGVAVSEGVVDRLGMPTEGQAEELMLGLAVCCCVLEMEKVAVALGVELEGSVAETETEGEALLPPALFPAPRAREGVSVAVTVAVRQPETVEV